MRSFALSVVARLPLTVLAALVLLHARSLGFSYALAGVAVGALTLGMAAGSPLAGRLVDRHGQATVLCGAGFLAGGATTAFALAPGGSPVLAVVLAALMGMAQPPVAACVRVVWARLLSDHDRDAMFALDVSVQAVAYIVGPVVMLWLAVSAGTEVALCAAGLLTLVGTVLFAGDPVARGRHTATPSRCRTGAGALAHSGVRTVVGLTAALGTAFGGVEVGVVAAAEHHHSAVPLSVLFGGWSLGALVAGPLWARRGSTGRPLHTAYILLLALALSTAFLALPFPAWSLIPGLVVFGALVTPLSTLLYTMLTRTAPAHALTEAYSWEVTGMASGVALGTTAAGVLVSLGGFQGAFLFSTAAMLLGGVVLGLRSSTVLVNARVPAELEKGESL